MRSELAGVAWLLGLSGGLGLGLERVQVIAQRADDGTDGARAVVRAVREAAEANARLPQRGAPGARAPFRRSGDELTAYYFRAAAAAARKLPADKAPGAFLVGLGVGLDHSTILRDNPLTRKLCRRIESDAERKKRLDALGSPTMRGRRDSCQHFVVSCALVEIVGAPLAEAAGLYKEVKDSQGGSGFSFIDLCADLAGIELATRLKKGELKLAALEKGYRVEDFLPEFTGLREDLQAAQFAKDYGSLRDKRFLAELEKVRTRVRALPVYKKKG